MYKLKESMIGIGSRRIEKIKRLISDSRASLIFIVTEKNRIICVSLESKNVKNIIETKIGIINQYCLV